MQYSVVINLGPHELKQRALFESFEQNGAVILTQQLREHMASISQLDMLISSSNGSMHVAAALGVPTVSLFLPTDRMLTVAVGSAGKPVGSDLAEKKLLSDTLPRRSKNMSPGRH